MINKSETTFKNDFTSEDYFRLRNTTGWHQLSNHQVEEVILDDSLKSSLVYQNKVVAICRAINDSSYIFLICDVIVDPSYQSQGLGKMLVEEMLERIKKLLDGSYGRVYIMSCKGKEGFYEKLGFKDDIATGLSIIMNKENS